MKVNRKDILVFFVVSAIFLALLVLCFYPAITASLNKEWGEGLILKEAMYYKKLAGNIVQCLLCPKSCVLKDKERGICGVRVNKRGTLYTLVYGKPAVMNLYPLRERSLIYCSADYNMLRIGTVGCNMKCKFCIVWMISQEKPEDISPETFSGIDAKTSATKLGPKGIFSAEDVVRHAKKNNCKIISFSVNESTVWYEYVLDIAKLAKKEGLTNIMLTNGYINKEPLEELLPYIDGISVGLKGFTEEFYRKYSSAELKPVLETLKLLKAKGASFEITYPLITTLNDSTDEIRNMCIWVKENLGTDVPLHFYRYYPSYRLANLPPTPVSELEGAKKIAQEAGIRYVYIYYSLGQSFAYGVDEKIYCSDCGKLILHRDKAGNLLTNNTKNGRCKFCGKQVSFIIVK